ncbi:TIGR01777 family oxidoreductase [Lentibacillus daqui]|uniref:TIGR01777 family oxidoreductase n=1 Tax=Lentibacillus daqui TaxID=2911514 RepID=UPI0022B0C85C|nr:TIGR01777 family oxidoreductase [Lentibacillus daqui]
MNILITGGTGFVGRHLTQLLTKEGHHAYVLTRFPEKYHNTTNTTYLHYPETPKALPIIHAVVNLAGESLFGYWTPRKKEAIRNSRILTTQTVIDLVQQMDKKPSVFISGSAVGYYGMSDDQIFTEQTTTPGNDFLAQVVTDWEKTASQASELGIRTVFTRFGVILGEKGALPYMSLPVRLFIGGKTGSGEQWISWVHIDDVVQLILFCIQNEHIDGPVNVTAPKPKRNKAFIRLLARVLHRPYWLPTPTTLIHTSLGQVSELITKGQYVLPKKAETFQYPFRYPDVESALKQILK